MMNKRVLSEERLNKMALNKGTLNKRPLSKGALAIALSSLKGFEKPVEKLEQYATDGQAASTILIAAADLGDISGRKIADLGCGTGALGVGAVMLGAKKVYFVDADESAIKIAQHNLKTASKEVRNATADSLTAYAAASEALSETLAALNPDDAYPDDTLNSPDSSVFINCDVSEFDIRCDTVIQNPPFGSRNRGADIRFIKQAMKLADVVWSIHPENSEEIITKAAQESGFEITHKIKMNLQLPMMYRHHRAKLKLARVLCVRLERNAGKKQ